MPRRQTRRRSAEEDRAEVEDRERTNLGSQDRVDTARGRASARLTGAISRNQRAADSNPRKVKEFHPLFRSNRSSASTDFFFFYFPLRTSRPSRPRSQQWYQSQVPLWFDLV